MGLQYMHNNAISENNRDVCLGPYLSIQISNATLIHKRIVSDSRAAFDM